MDCKISIGNIEQNECETCHSNLDWFKGYYRTYSKCSNLCVKCKSGCYNYCICSKRRLECKECKFCNIWVPLQNTVCSEIYESGCCERCKGDCDYVCNICKKNCDTECNCEIQCYFCENTFPRKEFLEEDGDYRSQAYTSHGQTIGKATPRCGDCGVRGCWCSEGTPCPTPCKECGTTCDSGCGCTCADCGCETKEGGCKCYEEDKILKIFLSSQKDSIETKMADKAYTISEIRKYEVELALAKSNGTLSSTMIVSDYIAIRTQNIVVLHEPKRTYANIYGRWGTDRLSTLGLKDGQKIRYKSQESWTGEFDSSEDGIHFGEDLYRSPSNFAGAYLKTKNPEATNPDGWTTCEYLDEKGVWAPLDSLRKK
jgi:hypothetical protein